MNAYLNYLLEASIGLCLFLFVYQLVLRKETTFRLNRIFLLIAILASVTFPLFHFATADSPIPSLNFSAQSPTVVAAPVAANNPIAEHSQPVLTLWEILAIVYAAGLLVFLMVFLLRVTAMVKALRLSSTQNFREHRIIETNRAESPFSFFNFIFIGNTPPLTEKEKQQIIAHENIHAQLYHSVDIVLLNILGIIFWFNPVVRIYKKIFVQLHEFEADARAVEMHDVDEYCTLLAKVALHSADYKLANHFSNSLTVKRIEMMRTLKQKIKNWRIAAVVAMVPIVFFVVSCQDQVESPQDAVEERALYTERDDRLPLVGVKISDQSIQDRLDALNKANPDKNYIAIEISYFLETEKDRKEDRLKFSDQLKKYDLPEVVEMHYEDVADPNMKSGFRRFALIDLNQALNPAISEKEINKTSEIVFDNAIEQPVEQINGEPIFLAVEKQAQPADGLIGLRSRLSKQITYPASAIHDRLEGKVFVKFVVKKDGTLTNFEIIKGISRDLDLEAIRAIQAEGNWTPGTQNGKAVNSQFVIPIEFKL